MAPGNLLALDFDGVICDSRPECLITGLAAYSHLEPERERPVRDIEALDPELVSRFMAHRHLVRVAKQFVLLFDLLFSNRALDDDIELEEQTNADPFRLEQYKKYFYAERQAWFEEDPASWFAHNYVFKDVLEVARIWYAREALAIVSAKDEQSIHSILGHKGLQMDPAWIFDTNKGDKPRHMQDLAKQYSEISFVDDNLQNLLMVHSDQVIPFLASWGFVSQHSLDTAQEAGIEVLEPLHFVERFS